MTDHKEVMRMALEAIEEVRSANQSEGKEGGSWIYKPATREHQMRVLKAYEALHVATEALRAAIDAPEVEAVASDNALNKAFDDGHRQADQEWQRRLEPMRAEARGYREAYFTLLGIAAKIKAMEPPAPMIITHPPTPPQSEVEPVAWMTPGQDLHLHNRENLRFSDWTPLYAHPPTPPQDADTMTVSRKPHNAGVHDQQMTPAVQAVIDAADKRDRDNGGMPIGCPTPAGCRESGCHGECLPQDTMTVRLTREQHEDLCEAVFEAAKTPEHQDRLLAALGTFPDAAEKGEL